MDSNTQLALNSPLSEVVCLYMSTYVRANHVITEPNKVL